MRFNNIYQCYKTVRFSVLEGKTIKTMNLDWFNDVLYTGNTIIRLTTTDGNRYIITDYPADKLYLMEKR